MCCYLYRKRSNTNNVKAKAKEQGRYANSRRRLRYFSRGIEKRASFPLVLVGAPRKESPQGLSSRSGNSVDSLGPSPRASGSPTCLPTSLSRMLPAVFTIKLPAKTPRALFPPIHGGGHQINAVGVISQDYKALRYTIMVHTSTEW